MTYRRVVPRDLFNEASLLKCIGKLWILLDGAGVHFAELAEGNGGAFDIQQDGGSGALEVVNLPLLVHGRPWRLTRPLNSRGAWPLYAETDDDCVSVFTDDGELSYEFRCLIGNA